MSRKQTNDQCKIFTVKQAAFSGKKKTKSNPKPYINPKLSPPQPTAVKAVIKGTFTFISPLRLGTVSPASPLRKRSSPEFWTYLDNNSIIIPAVCKPFHKFYLISQKRIFLSKCPLITHCSVHTMSLQLDPANTVFIPKKRISQWWGTAFHTSWWKGNQKIITMPCTHPEHSSCTVLGPWSATGQTALV